MPHERSHLRGGHPHSGVSVGSGGGRPGAPQPWPQAPVRHLAEVGGCPLSAQRSHTFLATTQSRVLALGPAVVQPNWGGAVRLRPQHPVGHAAPECQPGSLLEMENWGHWGGGGVTTATAADSVEWGEYILLPWSLQDGVSM